MRPFIAVNSTIRCSALLYDFQLAQHQGE
uniref:Uncharacterized protein n=1 Tax=Anguilla anguilla TaxID=7936 RepID=A0A0E9UM20_ANGAN